MLVSSRHDKDTHPAIPSLLQPCRFCMHSPAPMIFSGDSHCMQSSALIYPCGGSLQLVCQKHGNHTLVSSPEDFVTHVGDGGCQLECGERLPCGHTCHRRCHPDDPQHRTTKCLEPCARLCTQGLHPCRKLCSQECGDCSVGVNAQQLPCGHVADGVPCFE
jgi:hypothetical protein